VEDAPTGFETVSKPPVLTGMKKAGTARPFRLFQFMYIAD